MKPILKWAGGKQRLLPQLVPLLPDDWKERRYVEPFLGGGAMFFHLEPKTALLADVNFGLINMYQRLVKDWDLVHRLTERLGRQHSERSYYKHRESYNNERHVPFFVAAMFIYLNKACFNGLWRENLEGEMNTPFGKVASVSLPSEDHLREACKVLGGGSVHLHCQGFAETLGECHRGDFIYLDPPYDVEPGKTGYTAYSGAGFDRDEQEYLARLLVYSGRRRGIRWMMSNANTPWVRERYAKHNITEISAPRSINSDGAGRGNVTELVIRNY